MSVEPDEILPPSAPVNSLPSDAPTVVDRTSAAPAAPARDRRGSRALLGLGATLGVTLALGVGGGLWLARGVGTEPAPAAAAVAELEAPKAAVEPGSLAPLLPRVAQAEAPVMQAAEVMDLDNVAPSWGAVVPGPLPKAPGEPEAPAASAAPSVAAAPSAAPAVEAAPALPPFDRAAAKSALDAAGAAASGCRSSDGQTGTARVTVTFSPSGRATQALVDGVFAGTPVGSCIAQRMRTARIPAFSGERTTVGKTIVIE